MPVALAARARLSSRPSKPARDPLKANGQALYLEVSMGLPPNSQEYDKIRWLRTRELRRIEATNSITSWHRHYAEVELRRRENRWTGMRGWIAVVVSFVAVTVSLVNFWLT
jgi:hypothetical protein